MKRAFTLAEIMIVVVIIGLLAAMTIPIYFKIKYTNIEKAIQRGEKVSSEDREWYYAKRKDWGDDKKTSTPVSATESTSDIQSITLNNKRFYLIPKQQVKETVIDGQTYWLLPVNP